MGTENCVPQATIEIEVIVCGIGEQAPMLRDGRADVAFLTAPYDDLAGFDTEPLLIQLTCPRRVIPRS